VKADDLSVTRKPFSTYSKSGSRSEIPTLSDTAPPRADSRRIHILILGTRSTRVIKRSGLPRLVIVESIDLNDPRSSSALS